jgi:hypothetical protein
VPPPASMIWRTHRKVEKAKKQFKEALLFCPKRRGMDVEWRWYLP